MNCPSCSDVNVRRKGTRNGSQRYFCLSCGKWFKDNIEYKRFNIPEPDLTFYGPHEITDFPIIAGGDVHVPYHDVKAVEQFISRAIEIKAKTVFLAGDWLDCYQLSRFQRDPKKRSIEDEIADLRRIIECIRKELPNSKIIYKFGNHEERYDAYLMRQAPDLCRLQSVHLESLAELGLSELGVTVIKDKRIIKAGHLYIIHGHEYIFSISNPVNPARGLYNRAKKSALCFHHHQTSEHTEPSINGDIVTCWSAGCLCDLHPEYMPLNKWNHGFTEISMDDGFFNVRNRRIVNGRLL